MYHVTNLVGYKATKRGSVLGDQTSWRMPYPLSLAMSFVPLQLTHTPASPAHGLGGPFLSCVYLSLIKVTPSWPSHTGGPDSRFWGSWKSTLHVRVLSCVALMLNQGRVCHMCCIFGVFAWTTFLILNKGLTWPAQILFLLLETLQTLLMGGEAAWPPLWKVPWCWSKVLEHSELYSSTGACNV